MPYISYNKNGICLALLLQIAKPNKKCFIRYNKKKVKQWWSPIPLISIQLAICPQFKSSTTKNSITYGVGFPGSYKIYTHKFGRAKRVTGTTPHPCETKIQYSLIVEILSTNTSTRIIDYMKPSGQEIPLSSPLFLFILLRRTV